ncbi:MAG TPA: histidine--tRNA ligase [Candidatus Polarisedimenticolia bacterium]|nr:histidine--tRNA ligase [Candidatus Polarisedimenticolia bacterium]
MIEAVKGVRDILPEEIGRWQFVEAGARETFELYGFREIRKPIFESTDLFARGIGEATDIVAKEMYTFVDRKGRSLTLRPENTAPVVRAYIEHGMQRGSEIERLYYIGPMFRYERPQKGRMRQFHQIGVEVFGSDNPALDAETLEMAMAFLERLGIREARLAINSVGCLDCRPAYRAALLRYLEPHRSDLCADCQRRIETNPLRCFDCKVEADRALLARAPVILDHLCANCREHFGRVRSHLESFGIAYEIDPRLVRGLDYYRRTAFEVTLHGLGAQNALLGGGRYDGLVEALGGPPIPGFGFAVGEDRLVMSLPSESSIPTGAPDVCVLALGQAGLQRGLPLALQLRRLGRRVVLDPTPDRSLKAQMRRANDLRARFVLILGAQEIASGLLTLKRMSDGMQMTIHETDLEPRLKEMARG